MNTPTWMNVARLYKLNGAQGAWIGIQNTCSGRADGITGYFLIDVSPQFGWFCFFFFSVSFGVAKAGTKQLLETACS